MPIYVYKCIETGDVFEYRQSIKDEPLEYWPEDVEGYKPNRKVERKIVGGNLIKFEGSGFYETDYNNKKTK